MKPYAIHIPNGTKDVLYGECRTRRNLENALVDMFEKRGFTEVITPTLEYYDTFHRTGNTLPEEEMYKVIDRDGRILVMRPDLTTPIARVYATKIRQASDLHRFYYIRNIFRSGHSLKGQETEITQAGVELIGTNSFKSDLEILSLAITALKTCNIDDFHIEIGHSGLFRALLSQLGCSKETAEEIRRYIEQKNFAALCDSLEPYSDVSVAQSLTKLTRMFGGEEILREARSLAHDKESNDCIDYLELLYSELRSAGLADYIRFDLGLVNRINYYTGIVFLGYSEGIGEPILTGGRYDSLTAAFGSKTPATGFGININTIINHIPAVHIESPATIIHYGQGRFGDALQILGDTENGRCELSPCDTVEDTIQLAKRRKAKRVIVLDSSGGKKELTMADDGAFL